LRGSILAIGVAILVVGIILFFYGYSGLQEYGELGIWGVIFQVFSTEAQQTVQQLRLITLIGIVLGIVGFFTAIGGLVAKPSKIKKEKEEE
jgi:tellurite resistance protein TehA-like permease